MGKLIKYEVRKDLSAYISVFAMLVAFELYVVISLLLKNDKHVGISSVLFIMFGVGGIGIVMLMGVISYTRELGSKYSYMTFMLPRSTHQIVGAKYLTVLIVTVASTALYSVMLYLDMLLAQKVYVDQFRMVKLVDEFIKTISGKGIADFAVALAVTVIGIWLNILVTVSFAYLSVTLSYSLFSGKKGKVSLAVLFFLVLRIVSYIGISKIPVFDYGQTFMEMIKGSWIVYLIEIIFVIGTYLGISEMLKKKVSL